MRAISVSGGSGIALLATGEAPFAYNITLHTVLVGFALSIVFGHALIILPALAGLRLRCHRGLYLPLLLLHLPVAIRVYGGLFEDPAVRMASGMLTVAGQLTFAAVLVRARTTGDQPTARGPDFD